MDSIWTKTASPPSFETLTGDIETEAVVMGGGMAGILIAYHLQKKGISTILLEGNRIGSGQTKNTTAKITSQHSLIYAKLIKEFGEEKARQYARGNEQAIKEFEKIIKENNINCDFERKDSYLYTTKDKKGLLVEWEALSKLDISAKWVENTKLPFSIQSAIMFPNQAQFNPLKFINRLAQDLTIYENAMVNDVHHNKVLLDKATVTAKHIIFASHFPFVNSIGYFFTKMHQGRSYVLALKNAQNVDGMYIGIEDDTLSFRNAGDILLLGGGNHRTGENSSGGRYDNLRKIAKKLYPHSEEIGFWSAQDCMSADNVPYIGKVKKGQCEYYVATGFCKWGMTTSMLSGMLISDLIIGKENKFDIFSPKRLDVIASGKNVVKDGMQSIKGLSRELLSIPDTKIEELEKGHGGVVEYDGNKVGVYKNQEGESFLVSIRCPHLGCQLEWNPDELSWDCPCHGSRFDYKGNLIDNPAGKGIN